jgi:hypothetical protein
MLIKVSVSKGAATLLRLGYQPLVDLVARSGVMDQRPLTSGLPGARSTRGPEDRAIV